MTSTLYLRLADLWSMSTHLKLFIVQDIFGHGWDPLISPKHSKTRMHFHQLIVPIRMVPEVNHKKDM